MIKALVGKPGAGKSYVSLSIIEEELRTTTRPIITNLGIRVGDFAAFLHSKYGETFNLVDRLVKIDDSAVSRFWELRKEDLAGKGCVFVLDEVHRFFNARLWAENGKDKGKACLDYLSAHRHYGDDVFYITQNTKLLEKNFLRTTQDFTLLRNYTKERWGWFRGPARFRGEVFLSPPDNSQVSPIYTYGFKLDLDGLAKCYDTDALAKHPGQGADKGLRAKGLPVWLFPVGVVAAGALAFVVVRLVIGGITTTLAPRSNKLVTTNFNSMGAIVATTGSTSTNVFMTGLAVVDGRFTIYLSDGRRLRQGDIKVGLIGGDFVYYDGVRYEMR